MLQTRVIPCLLLQDGSLIKTTTFRKGLYIGDPVNTVRIFNELEVDELLLLDVTASYAKKGPDLKTISKVASQCFMPLGYGGGINSLDHARAVFKLGVEKIVVNTSALENPIFISDLVKYFGSQAIVVSIDVKKNIFGNYLLPKHIIELSSLPKTKSGKILRRVLKNLIENPNSNQIGDTSTILDSQIIVEARNKILNKLDF